MGRRPIESWVGLEAGTHGEAKETAILAFHASRPTTHLRSLARADARPTHVRRTPFHASPRLTLAGRAPSSCCRLLRALLVVLRSLLGTAVVLNITDNAAHAFVGWPSTRSAGALRDGPGARQHRLLRGISALVSAELHEHAARADCAGVPASPCTPRAMIFVLPAIVF